MLAASISFQDLKFYVLIYSFFTFYWEKKCFDWIDVFSGPWTVRYKKKIQSTLLLQLT